MTDADQSESDHAVASVIGRRIGGVLCALFAGTGLAGLWPGDSIVLGLLTSDGMLDLARLLGALLLGFAVLSNVDRRIRAALTICGGFAVAVGCWTLLEPHAGGLLPLGTTSAESILTIAVGAVGLSGAKVMSDPGPRNAGSVAVGG